VQSVEEDGEPGLGVCHGGLQQGVTSKIPCYCRYRNVHRCVLAVCTATVVHSPASTPSQEKRFKLDTGAIVIRGCKQFAPSRECPSGACRGRPVT
jgi:hypothetical protein